MKKLLFIGIVVLMVQSLGAVTLPSTSYSPYPSSTSSTGESVITDGGTMVTGSFSTLSAGECPHETTADCGTCCYNATKAQYDACMNSCMKTGGFEQCEETCLESSGYNSCVKDCETDPSLPLDGGLSILLILSVAGGMVKAYRVKEQGSRNK